MLSTLKHDRLLATFDHHPCVIFALQVMYAAIADYTSQGDGLSFKKGDLMELLDTLSSDWSAFVQVFLCMLL